MGSIEKTLNAKIDRLEVRIDKIEGRINSVERSLEERINTVEKSLTRGSIVSRESCALG